MILKILKKIAEKKDSKSIWWNCFAATAMSPLIWTLLFSVAVGDNNLWAEIGAYILFFLPILIFLFLVYTRRWVFQEQGLNTNNENQGKIDPSRGDKISKVSIVILFFELSLFYVGVYVLISGGIAA